MTWQFPLTPKAPDWSLNWSAIENALPFLRALESCPQDKQWHAEGNVLIHTRMVAEELVRLDEWRNFPESFRDILFIAALLHDIAKPLTTREEDGRIVAPKHTVVGQRVARRILWEMNVPFAVREQICGLVRYHGLPLRFIDKENPEKALRLSSFSAPNDHIALIAEADVRGRISSDQSELLDRVGMFREYSKEQEVWRQPWPHFCSDHHRFMYFRSSKLSNGYIPFDNTKFTATLMTGIPASGKDHWIKKHVKHDRVISLDAIRDELDIEPTDAQHEVISNAKEKAKTYLRLKQDFVWNATNITRDMRDQLVALFHSYGAAIRMVYAEAPIDELRRRNNARTIPVPERAVDRMIDKLEVPDVTECHEFELAIQS